MSSRRPTLLVVAGAAAASLAFTPLLGAAPTSSAALPATGVAEADNALLATGRLQDQYTNPAFHLRLQQETATTYTENLTDQLANPDRPIATLGQLVPGARAADPFRADWEAEGRGIQVEVEFEDRNGVRVQGSVWAPNLPYVDPVTGRSQVDQLPGVVITTGSIQGYQEMYLWAAQGLAEAGYLVMTYDVQGQGSTETFGHQPDGSLWCDLEACPGVPFQQDENFYRGTEEALDWFVSDANPLRALLDTDRIGLAGHSLGARAVTDIGNRAVPVPGRPDIEIDAVVAWDNANLGEVDPFTGETLEPRVPTMGQNAEYFFVPEPQLPADPDAGTGTFERFRAAGVPSYQVALRSSTHLEWTYVPLILPASSEGERVAMHYTLAWFDRYLRPVGERGRAARDLRADADRRLLAEVFDGSADASAIGTGTFDPATLANVPHTIEGDAVVDHLSPYLRSAYAFAGNDCTDVVAGC